ncbi:MAG: hypothetical protein ACRDAS_03705, partial [Cetobacterium sp.]
SAEYKYNYNWELEDEIYTLKFIKRNSGYYSSKKVDFSVNFTYSEKSVDKFLSEVAFTLYLEEFGLPFTSSEILFSGNNKNSKKFGNKTKKTVILEDVTKDSKMKNISNSWSKGKVYVDYNSNGIYDEIDEALEGINVSLQGKTVVTDENGDYFVENISSNTLFTVKLDKTYIDPLLYFDETKYYKLMPSTGMKIDIPLQNTTSLSGSISIQDDELDDKKSPFVYNKVLIVVKKDGVEIKRIKPEFDGFFISDGFVDGEYTIELMSTNSDYYFEKETYDALIKSSQNETGVFQLDDFILSKKSEEILDDV